MKSSSTPAFLWLLALVLPGCAVQSAAEPDEPLGVASQAFSATDGRSFDLVFRGANGGLRVDPLGPIATTCLTSAGEVGCPIARLDFHSAGLTLDQQKLVLDRVSAASFDESRTSILFKGSTVLVTVHDHRNGVDVTYTERRYVVERVYLAPQERTHVTTFYYLYTSSGNPYAVRTGVAAKFLPSYVQLTWAPGVSGPPAPLDDAIVTGTISPLPNQPFGAAIQADQYFARLAP